MAEQIARTSNLNVAGKLPKVFRPKQFSYLLMLPILTGDASDGPHSMNYRRDIDGLRALAVLPRRILSRGTWSAIGRFLRRRCLLCHLGVPNRRTDRG